MEARPCGGAGGQRGRGACAGKREAAMEPRPRRAERATSACGEEGRGDGDEALAPRAADRAASGKRHCRTVAEDTFFLEEFEKVFSGKFILPLSTV